MPFVPQNLVRNFSEFDPAPEEKPAPELNETWGAAFDLENDVTAYNEIVNRPAWTPEPGFNLGSWLKDYDAKNQTQLYEGFGDHFLGIDNSQEALYMVNKIAKEQKDRDILDRSGWMGYAASVTAGLASPLTFVPLVGAETRLASAYRMARAGFLTGVASEALLLEAHPTRTKTEAAVGVAASTALAGILGGTIGLVRPAERALMEKEIEATADSIAGRKAGVGAEVTAREDAGNIAPGAQQLSSMINKTGVLANPVTQNIQQETFGTWRWLTQQMSDAGLMMEKNVEGVATSVGGTVENRAMVYHGMLNTAAEDFDAAYKKYYFDSDAPRLFGDIRATVGGMVSKTKLSKAEFGEEVSKAIWEGYKSSIPAVEEIAKRVSELVFDPILKEAQKVGMISNDVEVVGDKAYASRLYNNTAIQRKTAKFLDIISGHMENKMKEAFAKQSEKIFKKQSQAKQTLEDMARPKEEVKQLIETLRKNLDELNANMPEEAAISEETAADLRAQARELLKQPQTIMRDEKRAQLLADARKMDEVGGKDLQETKIARADIRRRLRALAQNTAQLDAKRTAIQEKLGLLEEQSIASLNRLASRAHVLLKKMDKLSDKELDKELEKLWAKFGQANEVYDKNAARLDELESQFSEGQVAPYTTEKEMISAAKKADVIAGKIPGAEARATRASDKLDEVIAKVESAEHFDREEARQLIQDALDAVVERTYKANGRRTLRMAQLVDTAEQLSPEKLAEKLAAQAKIPGQLESDFNRKWSVIGGEGVDVATKSADFKDAAMRAAIEFKDKVVGTHLRLPFVDMLGQERGMELARMLDIPTKDIAEFVERDIGKIMRTYVRTMAPDIEIYRKFGSMDWREIIQPAADELNDKILKMGEAHKEAIKAIEAKAASKEAKAAEIAKLEKTFENRTAKLNAEYKTYKDNFEALIERVRGVRGMPADPDAVAYRGARMAMNLNVARMMGMVLFASFPDIAQPVLKYGLTRTFKDGFVPLIKNFKALKMTMQEAKLAGAANELTSHMRAMALRDLVDDMQRGTKLEKAIDWATSHIGVVALFDHWTQYMKMFTSVIANGKIMDALAKVNGAESTMEMEDAVTYLAQLGLTSKKVDYETVGKKGISESDVGALPFQIWKEITDNGGGSRTNGLWLPETEKWKSFENKMAYRQALHREVSRTIVSPGLERPLLSDVNTAGRMLYQFKSFGMASTPKVLLAGLQQKDAAVMSGTLASLAAGAMSYYLWAVATGGQAYDDMMNASPSKWADEATQRSGIMGGLGEVQRIAQNIPLISDYASFSGKKSTRRPGDNLLEALLGPSFDLAQGAAAVVGGLKEPTQSTLHEFRKLLPFQNTLLLREGFDAVEKALGSYLPERRK